MTTLITMRSASGSDRFGAAGAAAATGAGFAGGGGGGVTCWIIFVYSLGPAEPPGSPLPNGDRPSGRPNVGGGITGGRGDAAAGGGGSGGGPAGGSGGGRFGRPPNAPPPEGTADGVRPNGLLVPLGG